MRAKEKVKSTFLAAQTNFEGLMPTNLSYRARLRVVLFLDRILANERITVPSLQAILTSSSGNWQTISELEKTWKKSKNPPHHFPSFLLHAWDVINGSGSSFELFNYVVSCSAHAG